jgi:peptidase E
MSKEKQIIAIGGEGGDKDDSTLLDLYVLAQSSIKDPKICLIPTACGDNLNFIKYFHQRFKQYPCRVDYLSLFNPHTADLESFIMEQDIIYVSGGNTKSMLAVWREWGLDKILQKAYDNGIIMSGVSAGGVCWGGAFVTDSIPGEYRKLEGIGLTNYSFAPHYNSQKDRPAAYKQSIQEKLIPEGYASFECAGVHFKNGNLFRAFSSNPGAKSKKVSLNKEEKIVESDVRNIYLGSKNNLQRYIINSPVFSYLNNEVKNETTQENKQEKI